LVVQKLTVNLMNVRLRALVVFVTVLLTIAPRVLAESYAKSMVMINRVDVTFDTAGKKRFGIQSYATTVASTPTCEGGSKCRSRVAVR
jgi:hypothetical protein